MADERPRDRYRDRDGHGESRNSGRDRGERGGSPADRRNRSRSPRRERKRDTRYRSRSPVRRDDRRDDRRNDNRGRGRDPPRGPRAGGGRRPEPRTDAPVKAPAGPRVELKEEPASVKVEKPEFARPEDMDDETWEMVKTMGFNGFKSTKNTKVAGNDKNYAVRKDKKMEARQYMNRTGGFNRPLSPSRG